MQSTNVQSLKYNTYHENTNNNLYYSKPRTEPRLTIYHNLPNQIVHNIQKQTKMKNLKSVQLPSSYSINPLARETGVHLSSLLIDQHIKLHLPEGLSLEDRIASLSAYQIYINCITTMGDLEHTGDWDPYLVITFDDDSKLETSSGYWEWEIDGSDLIVTTDLEETEDSLPLILDDSPALEELTRHEIRLIKSIMLVE